MAENLASTRASLLIRLRTPGDESAWDEFVARYRPLIHGWCRRWQLQDDDAEEVAQMVLLRLAVKMRTFVYDPKQSFRAWLSTLARHAWCDFVADQKRGRGENWAPESIRSLETIAARDDLESRLAEAFDLELLDIATARVEDRVHETTWQAFRMTAIEGLQGAAVADRLRMSVAAVFKAKSNVQKMLREELETLDCEQPK